MSIPFTQFLRPNGRRKQVTTEADEETERLAHEVIEAGGVFEVEELTTGDVSMECINPAIEEGEPGFILSCRLCSNGPAVTTALQELVTESHQRMFQQEEGNDD